MAAELTDKQRAFVEGVLDPNVKTLAEAYRSAYETGGMSPKVIRNEAAVLRAHHGVTMAVERAQAVLERQRARDRVSRARAVLDRLEREIDATDATPTSRIAALRLLGIQEGLFSERSVVELAEPMPQSEADTLAEIEALMSDVIGGGGSDPGPDDI